MALVSAAVSDEGAATVNDDGTKTVTDTWQIVFDSITDTLDDALNALPQRFAVHPGVVLATVDTLSAKRTGPKSFVGTVNYSYDPKKKTGTDPTAWIPNWSLGFEQREELFEKEPDDAVGTPREVKNTAGEWFENGPTRESNLAVLSVEYNLTSISLALIRDTVGKTNSGSFLGLAAREVYCRSIRGVGPNYEGETAYATVTVEFLIDVNKHVVKLLSQGYNEKVGGVLVPIKVDSTQRDVSTPANLQEAGTHTPGSDAFELKFTKYEITSFAVFNLSLANLIGLSA